MIIGMSYDNRTKSGGVSLMSYSMNLEGCPQISILMIIGRGVIDVLFYDNRNLEGVLNYEVKVLEGQFKQLAPPYTTDLADWRLLE